jgi:two-component system response regulator VanR
MNKPRFNAPLEQKTYVVPDDEIPRTKRNLLLLEDDKDLASHLKMFLETEGFKVATAKDGMDGLRQVMATDFDIILCDVLMPNLPGNMFYIAVERTKPALAKRFIFITGHQSDQKINSFLKQVRGLCLFKPFQMHQLMETINVVLKKNAQND